MDRGTPRHQAGQARGNLMRSERQLSQSKMGLKNATRNRIIGGVILLFSVIVLILVNVAIGVVGLLIGGWLFVKAQRTIGQEVGSIDRLTSRITNDSAKLDELTSQPSTAD